MLRESNEERLALLAAIVDSSGDAIFSKNLDGVVTSWNKSAESMYGYTADEIVGRSVSLLIAPDHPDEMREILEQIRNGSRVANYETLRRRKDGTLVPISLSVSPIHDADGRVIGASTIARDITAEKQAAGYARSLIEASLDPLLTISPDGKITDVNEATVAITGATRESLIGTDFSDYFTEPEKARAGYQQVFATGSVTDYPLTIRDASGHCTDVLYNASLYKDAYGKPLGVFAAARDITAQEQAALYVRSLIEASLDPFVTISADGKITDVNEATIAITGVTRETLIGTDFSDYFTEPDKARAGYEQVFASGSVTDYPLTIRDKEGRLTEVLYNASLYKDADGNVAGVFAAARDVTAQRQAALYARSLIEASLDPFVTISPDGKITDVNEATTKVTGASRETLIGTDFSDYFTEPDKARAGYEQVFASGSVTDYPLTIRSKDGHLTQVNYNASLYRDADGKPLGAFAAARDVTAQKQAEAELARSNEELEQFAYLASHDLSEPLRAIAGPIAMVARRYQGRLDPDTDRFIAFAVDGCQRMQALIDDLLVWSRVGRLESAFAPIDVGVLVAEVLGNLRGTIEEKHAVVDVGAMPSVTAERSQLAQVLQNLISNALKFVSPDVAPHVQVEAHRQPGSWRFTVTDNGIGIDPRYRERVFGMFKRLHGPEEYPGTGIGLALAQKIVDRHGGKIGVTDAPGGSGSQFWFTIADKVGSG